MRAFYIRHGDPAPLGTGGFEEPIIEVSCASALREILSTTGNAAGIFIPDVECKAEHNARRTCRAS
jgi:hypothetical protein